MAKRFFAVSALLVLFGVLAVVVGSLVSVHRISNYARLVAVEVAVFSDVQCTRPVVNISWGLLSPGESKNFSCWMRSTSNVPVVVSMTVSNWVPLNISSWISVCWGCEGLMLYPGEVISVAFSLEVDSAIPYGFRDFTFDILVCGSG